ncbi:tyrosine-type recombinase/integrase [Bradyrhizobium sp. CSA112]|uniref:tyrosine-type recombinase/integrase n=1 Tax=Bradyrhizobium sp. CSA112 TaxID=2699170 RepID=UPI0023AF4D2D|nr:tyrosine-type recombinase/integrase [Bradyrhizobium sp. CSA112]MDE5452705.1 tyrosine-type recombinase/integrase [Bradyrhizobium sp. CSA112]
MARIRLKYVNQFANRDRADKRLRYYFRKRGHKAIPLPGLPGSEEFMDAYQMALAALPDATVEIGEKRTTPGTIDALCVSYYKSSDWSALAEDTRDARRRIIEKFRLKHGPKRARLIEEAHLVKIMNDIASLSSRRSWLKAIKHLLQHAVPIMRKNNPAEKIAQVKLPKSKGHWTWTDDQIATYRKHWKLGTKQRLVFEFALETVSRRGEVVRFGPQHCYVGGEGERRIRIERTHGSDDVDIPMSDALAEAIDAMPRLSVVNGVVPLTYLHTERGKVRSKKALGNDFAGWVKLAGLPDQCRLHGLKKGGMRRGAEAGFTTHELMAKSGHKSLAEVQRYTEAANKKKLADSGAAKMREAVAKVPKRITDQSANATYTNIETQLHKRGSK